MRDRLDIEYTGLVGQSVKFGLVGLDAMCLASESVTGAHVSSSKLAIVCRKSDAY